MKKISLAIVIFLIFGGCEKAFIEPDPANSPIENFNSLWKAVDEKYSFFEEKNIDWDEVYREYRPKIKEGMRSTELFQVLSDMLFELKDGHVNLSAGYNLSRNWEWYLNYPVNFDYNLLERNYLKKNYQITGPLRNAVIDSIGYVYYESFSSPVSPSVIDYVVARFRNMKGIIFDVRDNGGGSLNNAYTIVSRFMNEEKHLLSYYYKKGPGHNDFTNAVPKYVSPGGERQFTKPVVLLINRKCYSATTFFASMMSQLPNVTLIGDATGGGGGLPIHSELPNGWRYRFSSTVTLQPDGYNIEFGVQPDIKVDMTKEDIDAGKDTILEAALQKIKNQ